MNTLPEAPAAPPIRLRADGTRRFTSADFHVGQAVRCQDPNRFLADWRNYLRDRQGEVVAVGPATSTEGYTRNVNRVRVKWSKRNGRGKERVEWMRADNLVPIEPDSATPAV